MTNLKNFHENYYKNVIDISDKILICNELCNVTYKYTKINKQDIQMFNDGNFIFILVWLLKS